VPYCTRPSHGATLSTLLQVDPATIAKNDTAPMLEVQLELVAAELVWSPDLLKNSAGTGVRDMVESWLRGMLEAGTLLKRLDTGEGVCSCIPGWVLWQRGSVATKSGLDSCHAVWLRCCCETAVECVSTCPSAASPIQ